MKKIIAGIGFLIFSVLIARGQVLNPVSWNFASKRVGSNVFELRFDATIENGWHMYGLNIPENGPVATSFHFNENPDVQFQGKVEPEKKPEVQFDPTFEMNLELFSHQISFIQKVKVLVTKKIPVKGTLEFMVCDDTRCLPPKDVDFEFTLEPEPKQVTENIPKQKEALAAITVEQSAKLTKEKETLQDTPLKQTSTGDTLSGASDNNNIGVQSTDNTDNESKANTSLLRLFFLALLAGFAASITPCVYPIIPLTVAFFTRDVSRRKAILNGLIFGISIILIYTLFGLLVGIWKIDIRLLSSHWLPNIIFFLIFVALALSFFGVFELTLPGKLSNKIDQKADKGGFLGPFFMALATVLLSFSCTGPIVGVLLVSALQGQLVEPVVGMFGFSISFALPFTLLAIFPSFINKLPKSGGWLNTVKIFFAFFLLQFSLVFIGNLGLPFITREVILSLSIVMLFLLGMNIIGKLRFDHDTPLETVSVTRLFIAIIIFSIALYFTTGLFGAPLKGISPFLPEKSSLTSMITSSPPQSSVLDSTTSYKSTGICDEHPKYSGILELPLDLKGYFDYDEALACAGKLNKPVLLDFAGHSCKNCKKMYAEVWSDPRVLNMLKTKFVVAALYTDDRTKLPEKDWITSTIDGKVKNTIGKKFNDLQITKFNSNALPLYAIVDENGKVLTSVNYYTYSPDIENFLKFLKEGLNTYSAKN